MAESTSALSLKDLLLKVAKAGGVAYYGSAGTSRAMIPLDAHDLDKCLGIVNEGVRLFLASAPPNGWRWQNRLAEVTFGTEQIEGTVEGGSSTKLLDDTLKATYTANDDLNGYYVYDQTEEIYAAITDYTVSTGSITAFADYSGTVAGTVKATSATHGLSTNDMIIIAGTTSYNGAFTITKIDANSFYFTDTYVAAETSGSWTQTQITVAAWKTYDDRTTTSYPVSGDSYSITDVKTVCGDITRYFLPDGFMGDVSGKITYAQATGRGHIIDWCGEATIRFNQETTLTTGYPMYAAVRPSPVRRKWELVVDPQPTAADTVVFPYRIGFDKFQALTGTGTTGCSATAFYDSSLNNFYPNDYFNGWTIEVIAGTGQNSYAEVSDYTGGTAVFTVAKWLAADGTSTGTSPATSGSIYYVCDGYKHPAGMMFDEAVSSACLCKAEQEFEDLQLGYVQKFYQVDLPKAYELDARSAPRKLGVMQPAGGVRRLATWNDVGYINPSNGYYDD